MLLNRQYIQGVRKIIQSIPHSDIDPMENYRKMKVKNGRTLTFSKVNMSQLRRTIDSMRATGSTAEDFISMRAIKSAQREIEPLLLKLINRIIETNEYPETLKITKVVPIRKPLKEITTSEGWHPVNLVSSISKIIEKMLLKQMLEHLEAGELVNHAHHGARKSKSTQTLAMELYNKLLENVRNDKEIALITLDQSKAFKIVDHEILLKKMRHIGFTDKTLKTLKSYLTTRKQYVQVAGRDSDKLLVGDNSVTQGSTLSCTIYLIYVLDLPAIFHDEMHNPKEEMNCNETKAKTFVE